MRHELIRIVRKITKEWLQAGHQATAHVWMRANWCFDLNGNRVERMDGFEKYLRGRIHKIIVFV